MGADYSFYVKTIETHACAFFKVIIFSIGSVLSFLVFGKFDSFLAGRDINRVHSSVWCLVHFQNSLAKQKTGAKSLLF